MKNSIILGETKLGNGPDNFSVYMTTAKAHNGEYMVSVDIWNDDQEIHVHSEQGSTESIRETQARFMENISRNPYTWIQSRIG